MATLVRSPVIQKAHQHPKNLLPALFQPVNLLVSTLGIATAIALPLRNADAMAWTQVQHPSHVSGYLNPDTSKGSLKTLIAETRIPNGISVRGISTPEPARSVVDTSRSSQRVLFAVPSPVVPPPHLAPVRFWFQPADSTADVPKVLLPELSLPIGGNRRLSTPPHISTVVDTSKGSASVLFTIPSPFVPPLHLPPVKCWFQPADSTANVPSVLLPDLGTVDIVIGRHRRTRFYTGPLFLPEEKEAPLKPVRPEELYKRLAQLDAYIHRMQEIDDEESFYLLH